MSHGSYGFLRILLLGTLLAQALPVCAQQVFSEQGVSIEFSEVSRTVAAEEIRVRFKITGRTPTVSPPRHDC